MIDADVALERIDRAIAEHQTVAFYSLFSGGLDSLSSTLIASRHPAFDGVLHIDTTIGVPETREYVERVCSERGWKLVVRRPPIAYDEIVLDYGFPGPGGHTLIYNRLKERAMEGFSRDVKLALDVPMRRRILLASGVRRQESARRMRLPPDPISRVKGRVFVSTIYDATKLDVRRFVAESGVAENPVSALIHKSGECLCGAFAKPGELDELALWFPHVADRIRALEERVRTCGSERARLACRWGARPLAQAETLFDASPGPLCQSCV